MISVSCLKFLYQSITLLSIYSAISYLLFSNQYTYSSAHPLQKELYYGKKFAKYFDTSAGEYALSATTLLSMLSPTLFSLTLFSPTQFLVLPYFISYSHPSPTLTPTPFSLSPYSHSYPILTPYSHSYFILHYSHAYFILS